MEREREAGASASPRAEVCWTHQGFRICCDGHGFTVRGAGFTVWDDKLLDALAAARLLRLPSAEPRLGHDPSPPTPCGVGAAAGA